MIDTANLASSIAGRLQFAVAMKKINRKQLQDLVRDVDELYRDIVRVLKKREYTSITVIWTGKLRPHLHQLEELGFLTTPDLKLQTSGCSSFFIRGARLIRVSPATYP